MAHILVVDDEEGIRGFLKRALEIDGHAVTTASDGAEALDLFIEASGNYHLVISDIRMPIMDGIAFALAAKQAYPDAQILLMTGYAEQRERCKSLESIIIDVMSKPFNLTDMREKVKVLTASPAKKQGEKNTKTEFQMTPSA
jgi:two-component system, cell cycle response regulator CpdR